MIKQNVLAKLAYGASFFALVVIALGAFTRLMDAGLGCPDWPGCYGHLPLSLTAVTQHITTPLTKLMAYKAWVEMVHRYFVAGLSTIILSILVMIFCQKSLRGKLNLTLAIALCILLVYQIMLGQWTVTLKLLPMIVTQHLLGGFLILLTLWLVYLANQKKLIVSALNKKTKMRLLIGASVAFLLLLLQICLGAWTSTNYASLSCPDFPFCVNGQAQQFYFKAAFNLSAPIGTDYSGGVLATVVRQTIQMTHRFGALVLTLYLSIFVPLTLLKIRRFPQLVTTLYLMLGLLSMQVCVGITNVIFKLPLLLALAHTLLAALLLLSLTTFIFNLARTEVTDAPSL